MSKETVWNRFMADPSADALTESASMHYISSLYEVTGARNIAMHLKTTRKQTRNWQETTLKAREICNGEATELILEVDLSAEFNFDSAKNPWLPGLESNLFLGKQVQCAVVYFIQFQGDKIDGVRLYWDQATLLRQVEAIGAQGRRWPIADGAAAVQLVKRSVSNAPASNGPQTTSQAPAPSQSQSQSQGNGDRAYHVSQDPNHKPAILSQGPPQAQYNFLAPQQNGSQAATSSKGGPHAHATSSSAFEDRTPVIATNGPPQAQYNFLAPQSLGEQENIHGRAYNQGRRGQPAPQMNVAQGETAPALAAGKVVGSQGPPKPSYDFLRGE